MITSEPGRGGQENEAADGSSAEPVLLDQHDGAVRTLCLNRPAVGNALTVELMSRLGHALADAEADPSCRCVVLTSTGPDVFCSGMDLSEFSADGLDPAIWEEPGMAAFDRFLRGGIGVPVVGAAVGHAVAGGFELLLACDLVVAADGATFGLPEIKLGIFAAGGGALLGARLPLAVALELTLTGDRFDAQRALALGLINQIHDRDAIRAAAFSLAAKIAGHAPMAVAATRELVRLSARDIDAAWARQTELRDQVFDSDDAREGALAFLERRPPHWQGH